MLHHRARRELRFDLTLPFEPADARNVQMAGVGSNNGRFRSFKIGQQAIAFLIEPLPGLGQGHASRRAIE